MSEDTQVVFSWSKPQDGEIDLVFHIGENRFGMWFDKNGEGGWFIVSSDGITPQSWGTIPNECVRELQSLLTQRTTECICPETTSSAIYLCSQCGLPKARRI